MRKKEDTRERVLNRLWQRRYRAKHLEEEKIRVRLHYRKYRQNHLEQERIRLQFIRYGLPRKEILEKFDNQCVICGEHKDLCIHHKDGNGLKLNGHIKETINNNIENLTVLCRPCHFKYHARQEIII